DPREVLRLARPRRRPVPREGAARRSRASRSSDGAPDARRERPAPPRGEGGRGGGRTRAPRRSERGRPRAGRDGARLGGRGQGRGCLVEGPRVGRRERRPRDGPSQLVFLAVGSKPAKERALAQLASVLCHDGAALDELVQDAVVDAAESLTKKRFGPKSDRAARAERARRALAALAPPTTRRSGRDVI